MGSASILTHVLGLAIGAGLNLYAAVLVTGLGVRFGWLDNVPPELQLLAHPAVLATAAAFYIAEFVADKIPGFTPIWDAIHTFVRPIGGALLALGATAELHPLARAFAILAGGSVALAAHSSKMGFRLIAHTVPEPFTHSLISIAEDFGVVAILILAYQHPLVALPILLVILGGILLFLPTLIRVVRLLAGGVAGRLFFWLPGSGEPQRPAWLDEALEEVLPVGAVSPIRCFVRSGPAAPRFQRGFLVREHGRWLFFARSFFRTRCVALSNQDGLPPVERGIIYDTITLRDDRRRACTFYLTKEWSRSAVLREKTS
jgi:hypothetical protein